MGIAMVNDGPMVRSTGCLLPFCCLGGSSISTASFSMDEIALGALWNVFLTGSESKVSGTDFSSSSFRTAGTSVPGRMETPFFSESMARKPFM